MEYDKALEAGLIQEIYPLNEYLDNIIDNIDMQAIRNSRLKIALDPMYGVSETSIKTILLTARCEVDTIHERHDTLFGGKLPAPTAATLRPLQNFVLDGKCDIGIATVAMPTALASLTTKENSSTPTTSWCSSTTTW